jgi:hypothetical protein
VRYNIKKHRLALVILKWAQTYTGMGAPAMGFSLNSPVVSSLEEMIDDGLLFLNDRTYDKIYVIPGIITFRDDLPTDLVDVVVVHKSYQQTIKEMKESKMARSAKSATTKIATEKTSKAPKAPRASKSKAEVTKVAEKEHAKVIKVANEKHPCLCGCGTLVSSLFAQGHDARVKGVFLRVTSEKEKDGELAKVKELIKSKKLVSATFKRLIRDVQAARSL